MPEWIAYVDESGSGFGIGGGPSRLVLACVAGHPAEIARLEERIRRFKLELVPRADPANWELHSVAMFHDRGSPLGSMSTKRNMSVMQKIVDIVCESGVVTFSIVVTGAKMRRKRVTDAKVVGHAMALLAERLELLAQEIGEGTTMRVISDNMPAARRLAMKRALASGVTPHVTRIEFVDSRSSAAIQAVDALAYSINRHAGGDAAFRGLSGDIERKAWRRSGARGAETGPRRRSE